MIKDIRKRIDRPISPLSIHEDSPQLINAVSKLDANSLVSVVDDDPSMGRMLARMIGSAGLNVAVFTSAEEFLESERLRESDCLILDIDLPGMSGIELQDRLNNCGRNIPIIFITGQKDERKRARALGAGAVGFFNKPFCIASLLSAIQAVGRS
jgi:FixJ family two-component response regulator